MATENVGYAVGDFGFSEASATYVLTHNQATQNGFIIAVEVQSTAGNNLSGLEFASFSHDGGMTGNPETVSTVDDCDGAGMGTSGAAPETKTDPEDFDYFTINDTNKIGAYWSGGQFERDGSPDPNTHGYTTAGVDNIPCTDVAFARTFGDAIACEGLLDTEEPGAPAGRIMSSLVNAGGLVGMGGIAGQGGGLAG